MTTEERFTRIENALDRTTTTVEQLADNQQHLDEALATLADSHIKLAEQQAKTDTQIKALGHAVEQLSREWQAYLTTIRPQ